jgi:hypothetical protein
MAKSSNTRSKRKVEPTPDNYMVIRLDWSTNLVLPFEDGLVFLKSLRKAEMLVDRKIRPYSHHIGTEIISRNEYERHKLAHLLNVSIDDLPEDLTQEVA